LNIKEDPEPERTGDTGGVTLSPIDQISVDMNADDSAIIDRDKF
jgi:hypothetical protein